TAVGGGLGLVVLLAYLKLLDPNVFAAALDQLGLLLLSFRTFGESGILFAFGLVVGPGLLFVVGLLSRLLAGAWIPFVIARSWLALRGKLPWRLVAFLEDCHRLGILRQVGPVYQFRHARLQDHLAQPATNAGHWGSDPLSNWTNSVHL